MTLHRLPSRIAAVVIGTILIFLVTLGSFMIWMSRALDAQAWELSVAQVQEAQESLLNQITLTTFDYSKWKAGVEAVDAGDLAWMYDNIGVSATLAQVIQLVVVWGGRYEANIGWTDDGAVKSRASILDPGTLGLVESRLNSVPINTYVAAQFFFWHQGSLFAVAAARMENTRDPAAAGAADHEIERLLLGRRLSDKEMSGIGDSFGLTGLKLMRPAPANNPSVPLIGVDGEPVTFLTWDAPRPGGRQLHQMLPALFMVLTFATGLAVLGMALVRRSAMHLVRAEQLASTAALTDALTGLPNRAMFNKALAVQARAGERAILFLDINDFKRVNDSIGHPAGDQVIVVAAQRLANLVGPDCLLARIGGDEFVLLVEGPDAEPRIINLAEAAQTSLASPFSVLGHQMRLRMAVGYAVQSMDTMTSDTLVRQADLAMYEAKLHKGSGAVAFSAMLEEAAQGALVIEQGLRIALTEHPGEFSIAYQPIVDMNGRMIRAEALARWTSPALGIVPPDSFIAVAERAGLIVELGRKLFELVCDDLAVYQDLKVSVNISPLQLMAPDFIPALANSMERCCVEPSRVEIEITEAVIVNDCRLASERLYELHVAGFSTALDDFGTGYSSMGYLRSLTFDTLKIDRSFVSEIYGSADGADVVSGMILMAHGLKLHVVCEGVKTAEELHLLREMGCDLAQGYHFDRPMRIDALAERWLGQGTECPEAA